jgi:hypothetical protein
MPALKPLTQLVVIAPGVQVYVYGPPAPPLAEIQILPLLLAQPVGLDAVNETVIDGF